MSDDNHHPDISVACLLGVCAPAASHRPRNWPAGSASGARPWWGNRSHHVISIEKTYV